MNGATERSYVRTRVLAYWARILACSASYTGGPLDQAGSRHMVSHARAWDTTDRCLPDLAGHAAIW
jgi:hypothetical protein